MSATVIVGDVLEQLALLPSGSVHCCVTSPPYYGLRDYGTATWEGGDAACDHAAPTRQGETGQRADRTFTAGTPYRDVCDKCGAKRIDRQIGLEPTPEEYIAKMVAVFAEVRRVLRDDGTCFLNLGDSYAAGKPGRDDSGQNGRFGGPRIEPNQRKAPDGLKPKDLCMMPWRVALALQADGWWLRSVIVWHKKSPMPESVTDRPTSSWEPIFLLAKAERYFYDAEAVKLPPSGISGGTVFGGFKKGAALREQGIRVAGREFTEADRDRYMTMGANQRNVWALGPEPYAEAHFATFPTEIPRRAIKAGTSEKGCCAKCGKPWERVTESSRSFESGCGKSGRDPAGKNGKGLQGGGETGDVRRGPVVSTRTVGWRRACECDAGEPVPCVVLDPFLGSGTTVAVAREQGRHGIGIELNPEYAKLARRRIGKAEKPSTFRDYEAAEDAPLFVREEA